jgi:hypothetical protein
MKSAMESGAADAQKAGRQNDGDSRAHLGLKVQTL